MCAEKKRNGNAMVDSAPTPTTSQPDHCNIFPDISFQLVPGRRSKERSSWTSLKMQNVAWFCGTKNLKLERTVCSKDVLELYQHGPKSSTVKDNLSTISRFSWIWSIQMIACSQWYHRMGDRINLIWGSRGTDFPQAYHVNITILSQFVGWVKTAASIEAPSSPTTSGGLLCLPTQKSQRCILMHFAAWNATVDARNPAHPGMLKTL